MRRVSKTTISVGAVKLGAGNPIVVQCMTDTNTSDVIRSSIQIAELAKAGAELVRLTIDDEAAAAAVPKIREQLAKMDCQVPLIGDFHFNGHKLLKKYPECAAVLDKYRINPGNVGRGKQRDPQFRALIETACRYDKPVRIGANWGSLDQALLARALDDNARRQHPLSLKEIERQTLIDSALSSAAQAEEIGLAHDHLVISCKMSDVQDLITVYRQLAQSCDYALHLGLTEAGTGTRGIVASTAAMAVLLQEGIGDTLRVSLTPTPGQSRTREVTVAQQILQTLNIRSFNPMVIACPGCGRTSSDYFQHLADDIQTYLHDQMPHWKQHHPGVEDMRVAVMGCVVNGPGESKHAHVGISLPGRGEHPVAPVYLDGARYTTLKGETILQDFRQILTRYVQENYTA